MKKIGILLKDTNNKMIIYNNIINYLSNYDILLIGIIINDNYDFNKIRELINLCDGFILIGSNNNKINNVIKYLYDIDKPTLAIGLGMQEMVRAFNGTVELLDNNLHKNNNKYSHKINIKKDSILENIIGKNKIYVNSNHTFYVKETIFTVSSYSDDFIIESIEDKNKIFFVGVQWNPEFLEKDINSKLLFNYFIDRC
ncbi:MAG: gamma-glutamyl-gamma-aminobutyrate hydrolase family protein [Bacilli bacterium]|nr:gamma-glutamyl-gamma-aminobutyrate hydrolase family protein [Bacilli bacterium]